MKRWTLYSILALICCCTGCLYTLNPLFKPGDLKVDSRLPGNWKAEDDQIVIATAKPEELADFPKSLQDLQSKIYTLRYTDSDMHLKEEYLCFLLTLGQDQYIDLYPLKKPKASRAIQSMTTAGHKFFKIKLQDRKLEIHTLKDDFLENEIKQKKLNIAHIVRPDDTILITASTEDLQQYVLKYANVAEAFEKTPTIWTK